MNRKSLFGKRLTFTGTFACPSSLATPPLCGLLWRKRVQKTFSHKYIIQVCHIFINFSTVFCKFRVKSFTCAGNDPRSHGHEIRVSRGESASAHTMVGFVSIAEKKDRGLQNGPLSFHKAGPTQKSAVLLRRFLPNSRPLEPHATRYLKKLEK